MFVMVILQGFCSVHNISGRFPSAFIWGVTSSIDKVFESLALNSGVENSFNLILFCTINDYGRRWRLYVAGYGIGVIRGEERDVKHWVNFHLRR